jgi:prevent-host-death family protein
MTTIGVRDLKAHLSEYVARAASGEAVVVTERGRPVALLSPLPSGMQALDVMRRKGRVRWSGGKPKGLERRTPSLPQGKNPNVSGAVVEDRQR